MIIGSLPHCLVSLQGAVPSERIKSEILIKLQGHHLKKNSLPLPYPKI